MTGGHRVKMRTHMNAKNRRSSNAERHYRRLLLLYPARFRLKFGDEMLQLFRDQWREVQGSSGLRRLRFWLWLCADTGWAVGHEHLNKTCGVRSHAVALAFTIGGLLAVYLVSFGPAVYCLNKRDLLSPTIWNVVDSAYRPAGMLVYEYSGAYRAYVNWFGRKAKGL